MSMASSAEDSSFLHEIKCMMYSLGDARYPSPESASLIEEITKQQMKGVATKVTRMRGSHTVSMEDIMFLLRKDKGKLRRLVKHLHIKEFVKTATSSKLAGTAEDNPESEENGLPPQAKKKTVSISFFGPLDEGQNSFVEPDKEEEERLQKQDAITNEMDSSEYVDYTECRRVSFHKKAGKFKEWLMIGSHSEPKPTQELIEVLSYLAFETVREIVEMSLQVKKDMEHIDVDPYLAQSVRLPLHIPLFATSHLEGISTSCDGVHTSNASPLNLATLGNPKDISSIALRSSTQGWKREQNTSSTCVNRPTSTGGNATIRPSRGIQPEHVREAMRRHSSQAGALTPHAAHFIKQTFNHTTLCL